MKIGSFTTFAPEYTFPEACQLLKSIGYEGVQPRIVPDASAAYDARHITEIMLCGLESAREGRTVEISSRVVFG